ncbi:MAG: FAD-binding oxidoreductase [Mycobacteriales bacterium]
MITRRSVLRAGAGGAVVAAGGGLLTGGVARARTGPDWDRLRRHLAGELVLPADPGYDTARVSAFTRYDDIRPAAVAYCASAEDVRRCLLFAQDRGVAAVPRSGGHSGAGFSSTTGLVVDVSRFTGLSVGGDGDVTFGAGFRTVDLQARLSPYGLGLPGGSYPTVGAGGFIQGGGFGMDTRLSGMACDRLVAAEVVLACGRIVRCSARHEPDLFWALRGGGGGNFVVVTRYRARPVRALPVASFSLVWPWPVAAAVVAAWQEWLATGPNALSAGLLVMLGDAAPGAVPAVLVSGSYQAATGDVAQAGGQREADRLVDLVVQAGGQPPVNRSLSVASRLDTLMRTYQCGDRTVDQCHRVGDGPAGTIPRLGFAATADAFVGADVPASGVAAVLAAFDSARRAGHTRFLSATGLGGAANDVPRQATAYVHRDSRYLLSFTSQFGRAPDTPDERAAAQAWVDAGFAAMAPHTNGEAYQNFPDPRRSDWRRAYYGENYPRLVAVKRRYDPHRFFRFAQAIGV